MAASRRDVPGLLDDDPRLQKEETIRLPHEGRKALVTGAASGIGRATSLRLAAEGAQVLLADKNHDGLSETASRIVALGQCAYTYTGDLTDPRTVSEAVDQAVMHFGSIDILVTCAGIGHYAAVDEMTLANWRRVLDVDLTSVFLICRQVVPIMKNNRYGRVINIASQLGIRGAANHAAYSAAKAGVIAFTKSLAREVGHFGITANCVAPGPIDTALLRASQNVWTSAEIDRLPIPRLGQPDEVAGAVSFLAREVDGALFTGQTLGPNCGDVMQ